MKPSRYNIFLEQENGDTLAFNSGSATLATIEAQNYPIIKRLLENPASASSDDDRRLLETLCEGQFLIDDDTDELIQLKINNRRQRFGNSPLTITIAPTLACNFRCDYCFESQSAGAMSRDTEQALLKYSEQYIRRAPGLLITWFGGEPTLCLDTIERLQRGFQRSCARYEVQMLPSAIITNGYLLDAGMALRLQIAGVQEVQITLDGPGPVHDRRRKLAGGGGSYDRIIENIKHTADLLSINVRINIDRHNYGSAAEVLRDLQAHGLLGKVQISFAQVEAATTVCAGVRDRCFTTEEFSSGLVNLYRTLIEQGFDQVEYPMLAPGGHCGADCDASFVVSPDGTLFKCWEELSTDGAKAVGSVFATEPTPQQRKTLHTYLAWDPLEKAGCQSCDVLPICMGGCPRQAMDQNSLTTGACCSWKFNLKEMLVLRYLCELRKEVNS